MGMSFSTKSREKRHAFIKFSVNPSKIVSFIDANWGAQDVSIPKLHPRDVLLKLFKSRLPSGIVDVLHWSSRQTIIAHGSTETEIYTTDESCKSLSYIIQLIKDVNVTNTLIQFPVPVYNDNEASMKWSRNLTTKD